MLLANWLSGAVLGECKLSYENDVFMSWCNLRSRSIFANLLVKFQVHKINGLGVMTVGSWK